MFKNNHLSFSRVTKYEQCPRAFKLHYVDRLLSSPGVELRFGKAMHTTLEEVVGEHAAVGSIAPLSIEYALEVWQDTFAQEGLSGIGLFAEGLGMLRSFVESEGLVDWQKVIAVEEPFQLEFGRFTVVGAIDRVDRIDAETIRIRDYKTNRLLFTKDEVEESLQLSLYAIAAQQIRPWAKKIELQYDMLRHDVRLRTSRTVEQLDVARRYIVAIGEASERDEKYAPRPNPNCVYCDHRTQCSAYAEAVAGKRTIVATDIGDLEMVAKEREEVARIAKVAYARKGELEAVLKSRLQGDEALELAGRRYQMSHACSFEYPLEPTLKALAAATDTSRDELVRKLATIDKDALSALLKELGKELPKPRVRLLQAELEARATKTFTPRLWAKEVRP